MTSNILNYSSKCSDYYLKGAATTAYGQVCAPYHSWAVRTAVAAGMYALPTREQLLLKLNETSKFKSIFSSSCFYYYLI